MAQAAIQQTERTLPAAGTYDIDVTHSAVAFSVRHLVGKVRGGFTNFSGSVQVGETPEASSVEAHIDATTIHTGTQQRDDHLRSPDFLDVAQWPELVFRSTKVTQTG